MLYHLTKLEDSITIYLKGNITSIKSAIGNLKDGKYTLEIKKINQIRTISQNRYYWACLGLIAVEVGYIHEDMEKSIKGKIIDKLHEIFKDRFIKGEVIKSNKDKRKRLKLEPTTTDLDTKEFGKYMDKIRLLHPYLPDPEDKNLLEFIDQYYYK